MYILFITQSSTLFLSSKPLFPKLMSPSLHPNAMPLWLKTGKHWLISSADKGVGWHDRLAVTVFCSTHYRHYRAQSYTDSLVP
jgi:hypothetical protein